MEGVERRRDHALRLVLASDRMGGSLARRSGVAALRDAAFSLG